VKGLVFHEPGDLRVEQLPDPALPERGLLVRVRYAGVCGTDVRIFTGKKAVVAPRVIGHEFVGEVVAGAHPAWADRVGTRVAVYPVVTCGECYACRRGRKNICVRRRTFGYEIDGGFAELVAVPADAVDGGNVTVLPAGLSDEDAVLSEPATAVLHGIRRAGVGDGDTVLISGGGPIGLLHASVARLAGASRIILAEPQASRRALARQRGVDTVLDPAAGPLGQQLAAVTDGAGVDVAIIAAGVPALIGELLGALNKGARCVVFAGMPPGSTSLIDPNLVHYREIDVIGSSGSTPEAQRDVLEFISTGKLRVRDLISDLYPLDSWRAAFGQDGTVPAMKAVFSMGLN
jgi:L-iditol 2-dehydrogenase